jgi:ABC-2 type transport system permease protein
VRALGPTGAAGLWTAVAATSFRRYSTYRVATVSGIFTNAVFGVISSYVYLALWSQRPHLGGYDSIDAVTYTWIGQAMIVPAMVWGGGFQADLTERIRSGDIAIDLYRPTGLIPWWLAADLGRATFHFISRFAPMMAVGAALFSLRFPDGLHAAAFAVAAYLAVLVSFGIRFLVSLSAFWLLDSRGVEAVATILGMFCSGLLLPLVVFPTPARHVLEALPWATYIQTPAQVWLGQTGDVGGTALALASQAAWATILFAVAAAALRAATRVLVVQGG